MSYSQYLRLNLHVGDSYIEVVRRIRRTIKACHRNIPAMRGARHRLYSQMMTYHRNARELYRAVSSGNI